MKIIKRDGKEVSYNLSKITQALIKVNNQVEELTDDDIEKLTNIINNKIEKLKEPVEVETIQDIVEDTLMKNRFYKTAKSYILYRDNRTRIRENKSKLFREIATKINASNIINQNANVDEKSFGGRKGEASNELLKEFALNNCMSKKSRENHLNNEIYIHDLDSYALGNHNCLSIPFDDLLKNGFNTRQTDVRPANSINTAFQLLAVIFQLQSLQQFGGVSATHLDWTMVPYVRKSFFKHYKDGLHYLNNCDEIIGSEETSIEDECYKKWSKVYTYAYDMTLKEINQAVEGMYHNLNTLQSRSGNQLPFTSINYGTCTLKEGQLITEALIKGSIKGVGKVHKTAIFPCGIFQYMKGVNDKPGTPNYYLKRLALESTAKRLYPNYANVDWTGNKGYDINDPRTYFSTMGALDAKEHLYVKINNGEPIDISIKDLFDKIKNNEIIEGRPAQLHFPQERLNLPGKTKKCQDHSFKTCEAKSGVYKITYLPEDVTYIGSSSNIRQRWNEHKVSIRTTGGVNGSLCFRDPQLDNYLFEVIEYTDNYKQLEEKYILKEPNVNLRGVDSRYYKLVTRKYEPIYDRPNFKQNLTIPQDLIDLSEYDIKVFDINNQWTKIRHIFKNDKNNSPFMLHIKYNEFGKYYTLSCTEDHPLWTGDKFTQAKDLQVGDLLYRADGVALPILEISWHWETVDSYDIGTESGTFIGSDIMMHNCRTANGADINAEPGVNPQIKDGRGNLCPVTIILPTLAMEAGRDVEEFMKLLDKKINEAKDMLLERYEYMCAQDADSAKFMYENNLFIGYHPEEGIRSALRHGTLVIGQIAMAETLQLLLGCNQTKPEGMELAKRIEQLFKDRCAQFKQEYKLNFGVYYTPAENLCYTAMTKFKKQYGEIENVSDRDYFTNSIHIPVWEKVSVFQKIDLESQLTGYSNAGCITYVELESTINGNLEALEKIVDYAMSKDIPYFAVNVPCDECLDCGYSGQFDDRCPQCGSHNIRQLRRVTGYLTGNYKTAFNYGKIKETEDRVKHSI